VLICFSSEKRQTSGGEKREWKASALFFIGNAFFAFAFLERANERRKEWECRKLEHDGKVENKFFFLSLVARFSLSPPSLSSGGKKETLRVPRNGEGLPTAFSDFSERWTSRPRR